MAARKIFRAALVSVAVCVGPLVAAGEEPPPVDGLAEINREIDLVVDKCNSDPSCFRHFYSPIKRLLFQLKRERRISNKQFRKVRKRIRKLLSGSTTNVVNRS